MKKITLFSLIVATAVLVLTSCGRSGNRKSTNTLPETISVTVPYSTDTVISVTEKAVKTAPRYGCSGNKLKQPKLLGVSEKQVPVTISQSGSAKVDINLKD